MKDSVHSNKTPKSNKNSNDGLGQLNFIRRKSSTLPSYKDQYKIMEQDLKFTLHQIINKSSYMALRRQLKRSYTYVDSFQNTKQSDINVMGCQENLNNLSQLWTIIPDKIRKGELHIVHTQSNLALECSGDRVVLRPRQKKKQQLFSIQKWKQKSQLYDDAIYIRCQGVKKTLALKGILKAVDPKEQSQIQQFYIKKVDLYQPIKLQETFIISDPSFKGYCLTTNQQNPQVIQYRTVDYSFGQRWQITPFRNLEKYRRKMSQSQLCEGGKVLEEDEEDEIEDSFLGQKESNRNAKEPQEGLHQMDIKILSQAAKQILRVSEDNELFQISNFITKRSISVNKDNQIVMIQRSGARQWKVKYDGYSLSFYHKNKNMYLGVLNMKPTLVKQAKLWEKMQSKNQNLLM